MRDNKVRENRLRRMADRQGLKLRRSPRRDTHALDYDLYALTTHDGGKGTIHEQGPISIFALDLGAVERLLMHQGGPTQGRVSTSRAVERKHQGRARTSRTVEYKTQERGSTSGA